MQQLYEEYRRFQMDLEFVQMLANPQYLKYLRQYIDDDCFINYLKYLCYFKDPKYFKYIQYPMCIKILDCLQNQEFRIMIKDDIFIDKLEEQINLSFKYIQQS
ncbi:hypothetical protein pb186bvf_017353 [Paramecium bursaria]